LLCPERRNAVASTFIPDFSFIAFKISGSFAEPLAKKIAAK